MVSQALTHRDALYAKVDTFFARVAARHPTELACAPGCADCCADDLTVTRVEAEAIATLLAARAERHARGADDAAPLSPAPRGACAALSPAGACRIYPARPLVCRTHGIPVKTEGEAIEPLPKDDAKRHLPVVSALSVCPKNFKATDLATLESADILDQTTLSSILFALDRAFGNTRMDRVGLRELLERGIAESPPSKAR